MVYGLSSTLLVEPLSFYDSVSTVHIERFKVHGSSSSSCFLARWHKNNAIPTSWTVHVQRLKFIDLVSIASVQMPSNFSANCHKQRFKLNGSGRNGSASEIQVLRIKFYDSSWSANDLLSAVERLVWLRRSKFKGSIRVVQARIFVFGKPVWQSKFYVSDITGSRSNQVHPFWIYGTCAMVRVRGFQRYESNCSNDAQLISNGC